jgi:ABC-type transport system involved in multi-copper enzyme maturation permease subunit
MMVRRILRDDVWKTIAYTTVLALNLVATVLAYPTFKSNITAIVNLIPNFATFLKAVLTGAGGDKFAVFVALNHFFKGANVIGPAAAIIYALGTIVREVEIGTIGLLLSRPISRTRILLSFAAVHVLELTLPLFLVALVTPTLCESLIDETVPLAPLLWASLHASMFIAMVYALALLLAVVLVEQLRLAAIAGGLCIVSFMLYFVNQTLPWSIYVLSSVPMYVDIASGKAMPWGAFAICAAATAAFLTTAIVLFRRKDY